MAIDFVLPELGENIESADVVNVLVAEGDQIHANQSVVELETDKAVVEIPCPHAGKVVKVHVRKGQKIKVGEPLITVQTEQPAAAPAPTPPPPTTASASRAAVAAPTPAPSGAGAGTAVAAASTLSDGTMPAPAPSVAVASASSASCPVAQAPTAASSAGVPDSLIPAGRSLLTVAAPGLRALADVIDFMGHHAGVTDALIGSFGGFIVVSRMARWFEDGRKAVLAFQAVLEARGPIAALAAWSRGLGNMQRAEQGDAFATRSETGAMLQQDEVSAEGGAMGGIGGAASGMLRGGALIGGGMLAAKGMSQKLGWGQAAETVGGDAMMGAAIGSFIPGFGTVAGGLIAGGLGLVTEAYKYGVASRHQGGAPGGNSIHIDHVGITVPGAGNPQRVANAIPKALNAQIAQYQAMSARRGKQG